MRGPMFALIVVLGLAALLIGVFLNEIWDLLIDPIEAVFTR